jgi:hypothetical protein
VRGTAGTAASDDQFDEPRTWQSIVYAGFA